MPTEQRRAQIEPFTAYVVARTWPNELAHDGYGGRLLCRTYRDAAQRLLVDVRKNWASDDSGNWHALAVSVIPMDRSVVNGRHGYLVGTVRRIAHWRTGKSPSMQYIGVDWESRGVDLERHAADATHTMYYPLILYPSLREAKKWLAFQRQSFREDKREDEWESDAQRDKAIREWRRDPVEILPITMLPCAKLPAPIPTAEQCLRKTSHGRRLLEILKNAQPSKNYYCSEKDREEFLRECLQLVMKVGGVA